MMKRILCVMLLSVMTILGFMDKPCASKMISTMNHNNWQSFILSVGNITSARMSTYNSKLNATLVVDFFKEMCSTGYPQIIFPCQACQDNITPVPLYGESRIDTKRTQTIKYSMTTGDGYMFLKIEPTDGYRLLKEAIEGETVRFKIDLPNGEKVYFNFSLIGFTSAYNRAKNICINSSSSYDEDSAYFNNAPRKEAVPDAVYF